MMGAPRRYDREPVLKLWAAGESAPAIAAALDLPKRVVLNLVSRARLYGDRRAQRRRREGAGGRPRKVDQRPVFLRGW